MAQAIYTIDALNIPEIKAVVETARHVVYEIGVPRTCQGRHVMACIPCAPTCPACVARAGKEEAEK